jgi:transcriptional regulator with XRE-family HTH domain
VSTRQLQIADVDGLRTAIAEVAARYPDQRAAAKALRVNQATLWRILRGKVSRRISEATFNRIARALFTLDREMARRFERSVHSPESFENLTRYWGWWLTQHDALAPAARAVGAQLSAIPTYRRLIDRFLSDARERPTGEAPGDDRRVRLALYRALEPLAAADATGGIERGWQELHRRGQLADFLSASFRRELLLLEREPDVVRAMDRWRHIAIARALEEFLVHDDTSNQRPTTQRQERIRAADQRTRRAVRPNKKAV